jgi:hypothetical protein
MLEEALKEEQKKREESDRELAALRLKIKR